MSKICFRINFSSPLSPNSLVVLFFLLCLFQTNRVFACYTSIFSFGDSLADTGSRMFYDASFYCKNYPYGSTFFHRPTGRCSDGRLVIDFIAQELGLSFITPYLGRTNQDFAQGVNFAVAGATALDAKFYRDRGVPVHTNYSLGVQLGWFKQLLPSLCKTSSDCKNMLKTALFLVGEIGGNDYNHPLWDKVNIQEVKNFVPKVIDMISSTITALINEGAVTLLVPGNLPIGCSSSYLTIYESLNMNDYDSVTGCLKWLNGFSQFHNRLLQDELTRLRKRHPHTTIVYADYYNVAMELYRFPYRHGFTHDILRVCCGGGGPYNYNMSATCGHQGTNICHDASLYVGWDGVHLTEAAYKWIANGLFERSFTVPHINISCISSNSLNVNLPYS